MFLNALNNYDIVIFDCDGVLIDSNILKCEAFGNSVSEYPEDIVESFVDHCKKTFGISRYVKFKEFFSEFAKEPYDETKYHLFLDRYAHLCKELYLRSDLTPNVENLISIMKDNGQKLFVASGSDEKELIEVFEKRNIKKYFDIILGSPKKKIECVANIIEKYPGKNAVFIGDAISDLNSAKENNIDFIYMCKYTVQSKDQDQICRKEAILTIDTLEDLLL